MATVQKVRSQRKYLFFLETDRTLLARGETEWIFVDAQKGRPKSIPPEVASCFQLVPAEPSLEEIFR